MPSLQYLSGLRNDSFAEQTETTIQRDSTCFSHTTTLHFSNKKKGTMSTEEPKSPSLAELPKIPAELAKGVTKGRDLKHVETQEKNILPSSKDVYSEKVDPDLKEEIKAHETSKLRHTDTIEKIVLPTHEDVKRERVEEEMKSGIKNFDPQKLRSVSTEEKCVLPSSEDIAREKVPHLISKFDADSLKHVEPSVKTNLPTADEFVRDQVKNMAAKFDHGGLKHVEPNVKRDVEMLHKNRSYSMFNE
ncbi:hypothetical protein Tcan_03900 [Toxocara canis]|uniref:Thymosin beta-4 n=1 Tax=Toxocara canis TaxID=6265 RepID=A0A0B2UUE1_TOXCA|nr:hypothetical protein Tcan_03900 [Toxocara canis]